MRLFVRYVVLGKLGTLQLRYLRQPIVAGRVECKPSTAVKDIHIGFRGLFARVCCLFVGLLFFGQILLTFSYVL